MKTYLVGGAVRDKLLGIPVKEKDWVVVGSNPQEMLAQKFRQVGKEFPVFLHPLTHEEYALARTERKVAPGYKGFTFNASAEVTLEEDLQRRDLTINAMAEDVNGNLIDPYHGKKDLENKILRHVSPAFGEDPVRILRVARFAARYADRGFTVAPETNALMKNMITAGEVDALVAERVWKEFERALGEKSPATFFHILHQCGALSILFPMINIQSTEIIALKQAATTTEDKIVRFAALTHSFSKNDIDWICKRYRLPTEYKQVAKLVVKHHQSILNFSKLNANEILDLLLAIDAFRREIRFNKFLRTCEIIAAIQSREFSLEKIKKIWKAAKEINIHELIEQKLSGPEMAEQIRQRRLMKIREFNR